MQIVINLSAAGQTARLVNAFLMNYGYGILQPNDPQYLRIVDYLKNVEIAGSKIPFYTESNTTHNRAFYNDGKQTVEIVIDAKTGAGSLVRIQSNNKYLVPTGFNLTNMLIPAVGTRTTSTSAAELSKIDRVLAFGKSKFPEYLSDAVVAFA